LTLSRRRGYSRTIIVVQALGPPPQPGKMRLLLDIDVFRGGELPTDAKSCAATMEKLRQLKNTIFFASVTDDAIGYFA